MRRDSNVGNPMLVKLPKKGFTDTGEGGLAFFFVVKQKSPLRQTCIAGDILWPRHDCQIKPATWPHFSKEEIDLNDLCMEPIDAGLLIGSTGLSLRSASKDTYFIPTVEDLTPPGKDLIFASR